MVIGEGIVYHISSVGLEQPSNEGQVGGSSPPYENSTSKDVDNS